MKWVFALALLVASVAVLSGTVRAEEDEDPARETFFDRIAQRVRAITEKVLVAVKAKLAESKELYDEFKERLDAITAELAEVGKKTGKKALEAARALRDKVGELNKAILKRIKDKISGSLYTEEEKELDELLYKASFYADNIYDDEMINRIKEQVADLVTKVAARIEASLIDPLPKEDKKRTDLLAKVKALKERVKKGGDLLKDDLKGKDAFDLIKEIRGELTTLIDGARTILNPPTTPAPTTTTTKAGGGVFYANFDLRDALIAIRDIVTQPSGLQKLKAYLNNLQTSHPTIALVRGYVDASSDEALIELLKEFFSGFDGINLADFPVTDLRELFTVVRDEILTDTGIQKLRAYAKNIESSHPVVSKIKTALETRPSEAIRAFLKELFSGLGF